MEKETVIDLEATVEGKLRGKDARILGRFSGELALAGKLVLGEAARVQAKVEADVAEIGGEFQGELVARRLVLLESARVAGTLDAQSLAVREGAVVNGPVTAGEAARARLFAAPQAAAPDPVERPQLTGSPEIPEPEDSR